eukprot:TRINITY_DN95990_c0_g1_i1.p1 TRINITY_DN95990_c0_g1~~TRINITY_DN95990_c0_g1_i1.p1  ORF type:complete len:222 (-),score=60.07 TRINITY_DN95990_c0_g1_i1:121-786(-)
MSQLNTNTNELYMNSNSVGQASVNDYPKTGNKENTIEPVSSSDEAQKSRIHSSAVMLSISMESLKVYLNIKSAEYTQENSSAQSNILNIVNNEEIYDFLSGKESVSGLSLQSIGYEGKAITELNSQEAKELVSDEGFFGVTQTSERVSSFVIAIAGDNIEALKEARAGIEKGFEDAEKLWGGKLPDISYETQEKTLSIVDKKIEELSKTDLEKKIEDSSNS